MSNLFFTAKINGEKEIALKKETLTNEVCFTLDRSDLEGARDVIITSEVFDARVGDEGFYLLPPSKGTGGAPLVYFHERENCEKIVKEASAMFMAVGKPDAVYVVVADFTYRYLFCGTCTDGDYRAFLQLDFAEQPITDGVCLHLLTLDAGSDYNDVARAVRAYRLEKGQMRPLAEKIKEREELAYCMRHPEVRIRMGWKPVPSPEAHQTVENEPPMHVACTFARVRELADEFKRQGIEGAELCLVGWNQKGHDGRWPQIFPVEESLGGEEELKKTIAYVQSLGYYITCHTNLIDHYEIADSFRWDQLAHKADGEPKQQGCWGGGDAYHACPETQLKYAKQDLARVAALGFHGLHYIDVLSILPPPVCFHPDHICGSARGAECMSEIMQLCHELFGGFCSEGNMDYTIGELDFALYDSFASYRKEPEGFVDKLIPMWELIYHGITLYNPCSETVNYTIKTPDDAVTFALYGGKPAFYIYSKFRAEGKNWMGNIDMLIDTDEQLRETTSKILEAQETFRELVDLQTVYMKSYEEREDGLRVVTYENGVRVAGNYTDSALLLDGEAIPAHGYRILK